MTKPSKTPKTSPEPSKIIESTKRDNELGARRAVLEDLFYDFHSSRKQVYMMNFIRGLFFGFGSVLGATLLIAITVYVLGMFGDIFPPIADFLNRLTDTMQQRR